MLTIVPITTATLLQNAVETAKQSGKDYVTVARNILSKEKLTPAEITDFLEYFQLDVKLISVIFETRSVPAEIALDLLQKKRFDELLCMHAGKAECNDETFLITIITQAHAFSSPRARRLTRQFAQRLSPAAAICLLNNVHRDPNISNILNKQFEMAV